MVWILFLWMTTGILCFALVLKWILKDGFDTTDDPPLWPLFFLIFLVVLFWPVVVVRTALKKLGVIEQ